MVQLHDVEVGEASVNSIQVAASLGGGRSPQNTAVLKKSTAAVNVLGAPNQLGSVAVAFTGQIIQHEEHPSTHTRCVR